MVSLLGASGSGKTTLLTATARALDGRRRLGTLASGDGREAERLRDAGIRAVSCSAPPGSVLDATTVARTLPQIVCADVDYVLVENRGMPCCPAVSDIGQAATVVLLAATEDAQVRADPASLRGADLVLITKIDLRSGPANGRDATAAALAETVPSSCLLEISSRTGEGLEAWVTWLRRQEIAIAPGPFRR